MDQAFAALPAARPPFFQRLGARLALMVAVAMLPLGLLGLVQSQSANSQSQERINLAIMDETMRVATPQIRLVLAAQEIAATLAKALPASDLLNDPARCELLMRQIAADEPALSLVGFVPLSGKLTCASVGKDYDLSSNPVVKRLMTSETPAFSVNAKGPISGVSVLSVTHPVFDGAGNRLGFVAISMPHRALQEIGGPQTASDNGPLALLTFDADGTVLTSSVGLAETPQSLPADISLKDLARREAHTFTARSVAGEARIFSFVQMADGLFLLGSWGRSDGISVLGQDIGPYIFPVLMWLAAMFVALLGAETLVARHMRLLGRAMTAFAGGNRKRIQLDLARSPAEIREIGRCYDVLTETILHDEAELENMLRQKEILLREVHHRTGNSLQLIASIMRIHMRQEKSAAVRVILEGLHNRVMALATVHIGLYETAGQKDVNMQALFSDVIRQINNLGHHGREAMQIETDFQPIRLLPDQAVPLALLLTELLAGMSTEQSKSGSITVSLRMVETDEQRARLYVRGPSILTASALDQQSSNLIGAQLVRGFAQQIGGTVLDASTRAIVDVLVEFPVREGFENA